MKPKPTRTPAWAKGMRKFGPGVYGDEATQEIHIDQRELCEAFGVPYTAENAAVIEKVATKIVAEHFGPVLPEIVEDAPEGGE